MTKLEQCILDIVKRIPKGKVSTYGLIAKQVGNPRRARIVGNTLAKHPNVEKIPCHRVVKSTGEIGNYQLGVAKKRELLHNEGILIHRGRVANLDNFLYFNK